MILFFLYLNENPMLRSIPYASAKRFEPSKVLPLNYENVNTFKQTPHFPQSGYKI